MEDGGWIKLHRKFLNWEWRDTPEMVSLFVHLLLEANHEDRKWHGLVIERGQIVTSLGKLSQLTGLSVRQIRTGLSRMEQTGEISRKTTNSYTLITISNYERYQVREDDVRQTNDTRPTNERQTNDNPTTTNKNIKNIRNIIQPIKEGWRFLSSVQKAECGFDKDRMAEMKRELFRAEVESHARELGMTDQQTQAFVRYWTEHNPGSDRIRAENENPFDVRSRMEVWMERDRPRTEARPQEQARKTKLQQTIDERNKFQQVLYGRSIDSQPADGAPDIQ